MTKKIVTVIMTVVILFSTVSVNVLHAKALVTSSVGLYESMMLLLGLNGLRATSSAWVDGELDLSRLTNDIKDYNLDLYYWLLDISTKIASGNKIVGLDSYEKLMQFREWAYVYKGWNTIDTRGLVGTSTFDVNRLIVTGSTNQFTAGIYTVTLPDNGDSYLPVTWYQNGNYQTVFVPSVATLKTYGEGYSGGIGWFYSTSGPLAGSTLNGVTYGGSLLGYSVTVGTRRYNISDANFSFFNIDEYCTYPNSDNYRSTVNNFANAYFNGQITATTSNVYVIPMEKDNVAATTTDLTLVGAGTVADEDENGDVVLTGSPILDLTNIDIQALLKQLADNQITYDELVDALSLTAVKTETLTREDVEEIVKTKEIAIAGSSALTGNYTVSLKDLFPFCIPFDLYNIISCFKADPVAPSAEITIPVGYDGESFTWETYTVSLEAFDPVAAVVRVLEYVGFIIALMLVTRKLIEG